MSPQYTACRLFRWGVDYRLVPRLAALGIITPLRPRDADPALIRQRFNVVLQRTVMELRGMPCLDLERDRPDSKTICTSRSFGRAVEALDELAEALTSYVVRAVEKRGGSALPPVPWS